MECPNFQFKKIAQGNASYGSRSKNRSQTRKTRKGVTCPKKSDYSGQKWCVKAKRGGAVCETRQSASCVNPADNLCRIFCYKRGRKLRGARKVECPNDQCRSDF